MALNANALTTLATAKSHLTINANDPLQDTRVELFINAASQRIEVFTQRKLVSQSLTELQHGRRQNILLLHEFPVTAIAEIRVAFDNNFTPSETLVDATTYSIGDDKNSVIYQAHFATGYNNIRIMYTAGYSPVPSDLELVCLWMVEWFYLHRTRGDMGRTSINKGDESVGVLAAMPEMIKEIMMDYKRTEMPFSNSLTDNQ